MMRGKKTALIVVAFAFALTAMAYAFQYGYEWKYGEESATMPDISGGTTYIPSVYQYTEMDYLKMDYRGLRVAHALLKSNLTKAVKLLLEDAIEQHEPERFMVEWIDRFAGDYNIVKSDRYDHDYKLLVNGEWATVSESEYKSFVESYRSQQKQRIADMQSVLEVLTTMGE